MKTPNNKTCLNCDAKLEGLYCHQCGEKVIVDKDKSIFQIIGDFLNALFFLDNKFLRSIWTLIRRPGKLTNAYNNGPRKKYTKPISLFFFTNILVFLSFAGDMFDTPLHIQTEMFPHGTIAKNMVDTQIAERGINLETYASEYEKMSNTLSKTLIMLIIPIFAFWVMIFNWRSKKYFLDHFVFAMHTITFEILFVMLFVCHFVFFTAKLFNLPQLLQLFQDTYLSILLLICLAIYLFYALKRCYPSSVPIRIFKVIALIYLLFASLLFYRSILFFSTYYLT